MFLNSYTGNCGILETMNELLPKMYLQNLINTYYQFLEKINYWIEYKLAR